MQEVRTLCSLVVRGEKKANVSISVVFLNHEQTIHLNKKFLKHARTTDVISFCYETVPDLECEIFVNLDQAQEQCGTFNTSPRDEVRRLIIHGLLHAFGYDDLSEGDQFVMHARENKYLELFGRAQKNKA